MEKTAMQANSGMGHRAGFLHNMDGLYSNFVTNDVVIT